MSGLVVDESQRILQPEVLSFFDSPRDVELLPLVGMALPHDDQSIDESRLLPAISRLSERYREAVRAEAVRVAKRVSLPPEV